MIAQLVMLKMTTGRFRLVKMLSSMQTGWPIFAQLHTAVKMEEWLKTYGHTISHQYEGRKWVTCANTGELSHRIESMLRFRLKVRLKHR